MTTDAAARHPSGPKRRLRYTPWTNPFVEAFAVFAWFFTTAYRFDHDTEVLYGLCVYFLIGSYVYRAQMGPLLARGWPILLLPPWTLLSTIWSAVPFVTFKYALELALTVLICFYIVVRISPRAFIAALLIALGYYEIVSLPLLFDRPALFGVNWSEKNFFAYRMSLLMFAALAVLLDGKASRYLRLAAVPLLGLAMVMLAHAHSATSAVAALLGSGVIIGCTLLWAPARGYRAILVCIGVALVAGGVMILSNDPYFNMQEAFLNALGKDSTLTGRQELWDYAGKLIKQKPVLGLGEGGFWLSDRPDAQALLDTHFEPRGISWLFHNSYLELTVYTGLVGLCLGLAGWTWSLWRNLSHMLQHANVPTAFFAAISMVALARSYVESDLWQPFDYAQMIIWIGALFSWPALERRWVVKDATRPNPALAASVG